MSRLKPRDAAHGPAPASRDGRAEKSPAFKHRVLFVCVGNCIRSQLAEAFARAYGADVMEASSCGLAPAGFIAPPVLRILRERGVAAAGLRSKSLYEAGAGPFDVVVNISGEALPRQFPAPGRGGKVRDWVIADPFGKADEAFDAAAREIEARVMALVLELRRM